MLIATFGPTTAWVGKTITYDGRAFLLESHGPVPAAAVLEYDRQGHLVWASEETKELVHTVAQAAAAETTVPRGPAAVEQKKGLPWLLVVGVIAVVLVVFIVAIAWSVSSMNGAADQAGQAEQGATQNLGVTPAAPTAPAKGGLATVYTWSGGGEANDIRNSAPFALRGGHQVVTISAQQAGSDPSMTSLGWTIIAADGSGTNDMVNPASLGTTRSDYYLPAGNYYIASNTLACTWTVTVSEEQ